MKYILSVILIIMTTNLYAQQDISSYNSDRLVSRIANPDTVYVVNFWATWCGPCVKELPEFDKLQAFFKGKPVKILLVSMDFADDYPRKIEKFIRKKKLQHEVIWFNETNANEFIPKIAPVWQGSIPATLLSYKKNEYRNFFEGMIKAKQLQLLIEKQLAVQN